jgi:MtN3 and saliva related transmembrane protein
MEFIDILGLVAGICTSTSLVPQLVKTVKKKTAEDVSVFMFIVMLTGNSLWIWYGFSKSDFPIIATNFVSVALNTALIILKFKYKNAAPA